MTRFVVDAVLRCRAWDLAEKLGWASTYDAEYVALTQLQADALVTLDTELARLAEGTVQVASIEDLQWASGEGLHPAHGVRAVVTSAARRREPANCGRPAGSLMRRGCRKRQAAPNGCLPDDRGAELRLDARLPRGRSTAVRPACRR